MSTSFSAIGQPVPQEEGPEKVSGKALYAADLLLPSLGDPAEPLEAADERRLGAKYLSLERLADLHAAQE